MENPLNWHRAHKANLSMGDRAADHLRNSMGSWRFVFVFVAGMAVWAVVNSLSGYHHWDPYPFILLNLLLSMLAGLQGAILLIAAKRADAVAGAMAEHDYQTNRAAKREVEELMTINREQLALIRDLRAELRAHRHPTHNSKD